MEEFKELIFKSKQAVNKDKGIDNNEVKLID